MENFRPAASGERLCGQVVTGTGGHARWMMEYADLYAARTGARLFPGSLNIALDQPWHPPAGGARLQPPEYRVGLSITPCRIGGVAAFILRTDKNDSGIGDHPPTVIEVAASVCLREALCLHDGDTVEVRVNIPGGPPEMA